MIIIICVGLGRNSLINGFGYHPHHVTRRRTTRGRGVRKTAGNVVKHIGYALVDRLSNTIAGSGYKLAGGSGRHHVKHHIRKPRATIGMGRRRVHHRRIF